MLIRSIILALSLSDKSYKEFTAQLKRNKEIDQHFAETFIELTEELRKEGTHEETHC
ncbi:hypothetical protein [Coprococcus sp. TF11-13]|jgi:hypothetical protein|uniref:hypothetical protein n=1 Tax=Coprococcus sp. TF11-13 TaxID=2293096 RepID=UPI001314518C|nr:hypothetical protein [Coprococcus sp. TF11-13]